MNKPESLGGAETDNYDKKPDPKYCDKGGHKERSLANEPNHKDHWSKEEKKGK